MQYVAGPEIWSIQAGTGPVSRGKSMTNGLEPFSEKCTASAATAREMPSLTLKVSWALRWFQRFWPTPGSSSTVGIPQVGWPTPLPPRPRR